MFELSKYITKNMFLKGFAALVVVLALVRYIFPSVAQDKQVQEQVVADTIQTIPASPATPAVQPAQAASSLSPAPASPTVYTEKKHPIFGVHNYKEAFPDSNDVQLTAALANGISPLADRTELEHRKSEMVFVGANPFYNLANLKRSVPYLVPKAAVLLQDIGRNFYDSLYVKHIPLHQMIVTSVTRHLYGTTFDICYNRYVTVQPPQSPIRRAVQNDTLKWVLSEVLRDMRQQQRCYIKYEVKQGCFHITVR